MSKLRNKVAAFVGGALLPLIVFAGLESGTYISDLVATNPLGSDLASTLDDHLRLLKSTIKTTFPNINGAVTVTDEQLNAVATNVAANPTGTIGLSAVNGSASTYLRSDGAPALSQAIAPTWTAQHVFSKTGGGSTAAVYVNSNTPFVTFNQANGSTNNKRWDIGPSSEALLFRLNSDDDATATNWMTVDRTAAVVDTVAFPTDLNANDCCFLVGTDQAGTINNQLARFRAATAATAIYAANATASSSTIYINSQVGSGDNIFVTFATETTALGSVRGSIDYNRAGTAVRYNTSSDERLKKNFKAAPSSRSVIDCIKIESFDWRETGAHVDHGVVAQRLNQCAPYAVSKGETWQVDKSTLIPAMIKYMQEQDARIARLEADAARRH